MLPNTPLATMLASAFCFIVMPLGIFVCKRLYDKIKNEEHKEKGKVVQTIIKNYCLIQVIGWPALFLLSATIQINNDALHIVDASKTLNAIHMLRALYHFYRVYLSFHSLIVAITRYTFVMYNIQTEIYGINRLKNLFLSCSVGIPLFHTFISICVQPFEVRWLTLLAVYNDSVSVPSEAHDLFFHRVAIAEKYNIGLYNLISTFFPSQLVFALQILDSTIFILISMNIIELFLYTHLFVHFYRYDKYF